VAGRDPATGSPLPLRYVTTKEGPDRKKLEIQVAIPGQKEMTVATIRYSRRRS
jgi:hypothetical protein